MTMYFFHVRHGEDLIEDDEGVDLPDQATASEEALHIARAAITEAMSIGTAIDPQIIEIWDDERCREVLHVFAEPTETIH
jgi:hypothetical protein